MKVGHKTESHLCHFLHHQMCLADEVKDSTWRNSFFYPFPYYFFVSLTIASFKWRGEGRDILQWYFVKYAFKQIGSSGIWILSFLGSSSIKILEYVCTTFLNFSGHSSGGNSGISIFCGGSGPANFWAYTWTCEAFRFLLGHSTFRIPSLFCVYQFITNLSESWGLKIQNIVDHLPCPQSFLLILHPNCFANYFIISIDAPVSRKPSLTL